MRLINWFAPLTALFILAAGPAAVGRPRLDDQEKRPAARKPTRATDRGGGRANEADDADERDDEDIAETRKRGRGADERDAAEDFDASDDEPSEDADDVDSMDDGDIDAPLDPDDADVPLDPADDDLSDDPNALPADADERVLLDAKASAVRVEEAVMDLRSEYAAMRQSKGRVPLRERATYFFDQGQALDQKALVAALEKPIGSDPRLTAYVKWQLLSGMPDAPLEPGLAQRLAEVYRRAPVPLTRYGISTADQRKLDGMLVGSTREDAPGFTDMLDEAVAKNVEANKVIFAYRDALYAALPNGYDKAVAGLRDAAARLDAGWPPKDTMKQVIADATLWAASVDAQPKQCAALAQLVYRLRSRRGPKYYAGVAMRKSGNHPYWMYRTEALYDSKKLGELQKALEARAGVRRPPPGRRR